jgi:pimeloyl-ACP methyl ester esterase
MSVSLSLLSATHSTLSAPIVLLHGWGCDSRIWQPLLPLFAQRADLIVVDISYIGESAESLCEQLVSALPARFYLCGWSLGGMLATRIAAIFPERVCGLITLASNACFVASADWPIAMATDTFKAFFAEIEQNPLKGLKRFALLEIHGDEFAKQQLQWLVGLSTNTITLENLLAGLSMLETLDNTALLAAITCPALYIFGEKDSLVPVAAMERFQKIANEQQSVRSIPQRGHLLHYPVDTLWPHVDNFLSAASAVSVSHD